MTKEQPLCIEIESAKNGIIARNNVQRKITDENRDPELSIDNLVTRYSFLHQTRIIIEDSDRERTIHIPLFERNQEGGV